MPIHNEDQTLINLARNVLSGVDSAKEFTAVQTGTLCLLLTSMIERFTPKIMAQTEEAADRTVRHFIARVTTLEKDRDESSQAAPRKSWS